MTTTLPVSERDFQAQVLEAAQLLGWKRAHFRPAQTAKGWRTPVAGDGVGFPDLILLRRSRLIVAELKTEKGRISPAQEAWLEAWEVFADAVNYGATRVNVCVWRPDQFDEITRVLR